MITTPATHKQASRFAMVIRSIRVSSMHRYYGMAADPSMPLEIGLEARNGGTCGVDVPRIRAVILPSPDCRLRLLGI